VPCPISERACAPRRCRRAFRFPALIGVGDAVGNGAPGRDRATEARRHLRVRMPRSEMGRDVTGLAQLVPEELEATGRNRDRARLPAQNLAHKRVWGEMPPRQPGIPLRRTMSAAAAPRRALMLLQAGGGSMESAGHRAHGLRRVITHTASGRKSATVKSAEAAAK